MTPTLPQPLEGYGDGLRQLKTEIAHRPQQRFGWGVKVIDHLARGLKGAFPDIRGFSRQNLKYMVYFAECCLNGQFGQQSAAQLSWFHVVILQPKLISGELRVSDAEHSLGGR